MLLDETRDLLRRAPRCAGPNLRRRLTAALGGLLLALAFVGGATALASAPARATTHEPTDLVAVAQGGVQGYCYWGELQGPPSAVWDRHPRITRYTYDRGYGIPIYEADGATRIGTFDLSGPGSGSGGGGADGSRHEETADAYGTIIDTRKSSSGRITITRTWLNGVTTTDTAAGDPSLKRIPKAERPRTWRAITLWFRDVGPKHPELTSRAPKAPAWLVDKMSAAARAAGDAGASARWTLTFRRCAAPLEGASTPTTDRGKYTIVWIAVLRGAFTDGDWSYLMLDRRSHDVLSQGTSAEPFDRSMLPLQGRTRLH